MRWETITTKDDSPVGIPDNWLLPHYYEALNALFRIENALRIFVYIVLKNEFNEKWVEINVRSDDAAQSTIGNIAKQRMNQTKRFAYLGYQVPCPLMYMTSGELIRLIVSDSYWKLFSAYFPGSKEIISNKLDEINSVRNALAHFRPIKKDDIDLIKQNARHVLTKIESCLVQIMRCPDVVPTNIMDDWYIELKTLETEQFRFSFTQSDDEKWIKVSFEYINPILDREVGRGSYRKYRVLNLNTSAILHLFPKLQGLLLFLSERIAWKSLNFDDPNFRKSVAMVFSHEVIAREYETIKQQLESILRKISDESGLLQDDNLARGELVYAVDLESSWIYGDESEGFWELEISKLRCVAKENDPPEYWGELIYVTDNYVTSTDQYPWMPVNISEIPI